MITPPQCQFPTQMVPLMSQRVGSRSLRRARQAPLMKGHVGRKRRPFSPDWDTLGAWLEVCERGRHLNQTTFNAAATAISVGEKEQGGLKDSTSEVSSR